MEITVLIPSPICLDTALPYIDDLYRRNVGIHFVVDRGIEGSELFQRALSVQFVDDIAARHPFSKILHDFLRLAFTADTWSPIYRRWLEQRLSGKSKPQKKILSLIAKSAWKWPGYDVNRHLNKWMRRVLSNPFPTSRVIYFTNTSRPHLLCGAGLRVYTILESWDHPGKAPVGHSSEKVFVWNSPLERDWREFQGDNEIGRSYPVKLAYAIQASDLRRREQCPTVHNRFMYPLTFGSSSDSRMFSEEMRLIRELCVTTEKIGKKLLIKPKPNSAQGELDRFLEFPHVEIGDYQSNNGGSSYRLPEAYNLQRIKELEKCDLVVNLGTTFAMDAAAFGLPVIQLLMSCREQYPYLSTLKTFPHLARHFYDKSDYLFEISDSSPVSEQLSFLLESTHYQSQAEGFSSELREWLAPKCSLNDAVISVIDCCLDLEGPESRSAPKGVHE